MTISKCFCGGDAVLIEDIYLKQTFEVFCNKCKVSSGFFSTKTMAIKKWNDCIKRYK